MTAATPGASIAMDAVANLRDLGGWAGADGRVVRPGRVFRSAAIGRASAADLIRLADLGIGTVVDLRTDAERADLPDVAPPNAIELVADVLADHAEGAPAQLGAVLTDPPRATAYLSGGRAEQLLGGAYRSIVGLDSALAAYRLTFARLLDDPGHALLFHCTTGKDRTGWGAAALLLLLGVDPGDVRREYLLTNEQLLPTLRPMFDAFRAGGGDPDVLIPVFGVREAYLDTALDEMRSRYGDIETYFATGLGLDAAAQQALRDRLLVPADRG